MFTGVFRKTIGLFILAVGIGIMVSLLVPFWLWISMVACCLIILRYFMVSILEGGVKYEDSCI